MTEEKVSRGDVFYADLSPVIGSEQGGVRPVLIVQNNVGNRFSPTVIAIAISSQGKPDLPTHVVLHPEECGLPKRSIVMAEQIRTLDKTRLLYKKGHISSKVMDKIDNSMKVSLGLAAS